MEHLIYDYISKTTDNISNIKQEYLYLIKENYSVVTLQQKEYYIYAGEIQTSIGYIVKGLIRAYYIDHNGNEITVNFIKDGEYATHYPALKNNEPSKFYFQCIEPTTIINIPYNFLLDLCKKSHKTERSFRLLLVDVFANHLNRIEGFLFKNAEQRYLTFIKDNPDLFNRISITDLSSYLGVERQSLTRIRKKILNK